MKKHLYKWLPLTLIVILAIFLRFYQLGNIPIELNRDEASLGYTAYSLLVSGVEEHDVSWPVNIESFGDWKLPVYIYALIPFIKLFGLKAWVVKLPSALAGVGIVIMSSLLAWIFTKNWRDEKSRVLLTTIVGLMVTLSPWNIHMSHMAYEANLGMLFMMIAVALFITSMQVVSKRALIIPSAFFFGLTFFSYHSYQLFSPLFVLALILIYWNDVSKVLEKSRKESIIAGIIGIFFTIVLLATSLSANKTKFAGLSIFDKSSYAVVMEENRGYFKSRNSIFAKIHSNSFYFIFNQAQHNIADMFSSKFLFFEGGTHGSHDIPGTGKMHPVAFIFLMVAGYKFLLAWQQKKLSRLHKTIMTWLTIAVLAPFITFGAAHTIRFSPALFALEFLSAYGLFTLISDAKSQTKKITFLKGLIAILLFILFYSFLYFFTTYFMVAPKRDINNQNWQIQRLVELVTDRYEQYDTIYMPGTEWSPYIYFLYFNQVDPVTLSQDIKFFEPNHEGFRHVKRLGKINFTSIDWNETSENSILYVIKKREVPIDKLESESYSLEYSLTNPYTKHEWLLLSKN